MKNNNILYIVLIVVGVIGLILGIKYTNGSNLGSEISNNNVSSSNVTIVDGEQLIDIIIGPGYKPRQTNAKANIPTKIRIQGNNAFGCESSLRIPKISYAKNFQPNDSDIVDIQTPKPGDNIKGLCSMGMYSFNISFN